MRTVPVPVPWKQRDYKFKATLGYRTSLCLQQRQRECSKTNPSSSAKSLFPPQLSFFWEGEQRGVTAPHPRSN